MSASIERAGPPFFIIPFIVSSAFLMEALDSNIVIASIPAMAAAFDVAPARLNLVVTSYVLSLAVFIPISGWIADRFGARRVFLSAMAAFLLGSVLCTLSTSLGMLVAARVLQGAAGALMTPVGRLILLRSFSRKDLVAAISYMTMPVLVGPLLGPLLGGFITTYGDWRWIFLVNLPIGLVGMAAAFRYIDDLPTPKPPAFDVGGFLLVAVALVLFQMTIENLVHPVFPPGAGPLLLAGSIAAAAVFWLHARRATNPALDIGLLRLRPFRGGVLVGGLSRIGMNAVPFLLQLKLQLGLGYSPVHAGALVFIIAFGALSLKLATKRILRVLGFRRLLSINALLGGLLTAGFCLFDQQTPLWLLIAHTFLFGFARSLQFNAINALIYADLHEERQSAGVSLAGTAQQVSMGLGVSFAAIFLARGEASAEISLNAYDLAFQAMGAVLVLSAAGFLFLKREDGAEASGHRP